MNNFGRYMTAKEYFAFKSNFSDPNPLSYYEVLANKKDELCEVCETENEWKLGNCGMCFTCATGESDASEDIELVPSK